MSKPYVYQQKAVSVPYHDVVRLDYSNIPFLNDTLIGSVNNVGSFDIYDLSIYASAHNRTAAQIDSVTNRTIPILKSGESTFFWLR
jgi:hypothetical protein